MLKDDSIMPFGTHRKKPMREVPDEWLMWFYGENKSDFHGGLADEQTDLIMVYIEDSFNDNDLTQ